MTNQLPQIQINATDIRIVDGLYCLNDLHKSAGNESKHQPTFFLRLDTVKVLIDEINQSADMQSAVKTINGGANRGTYVCKELVYAYAMWISAKFHLTVIRTFDSLVQRQLSISTIPQTKLNDAQQRELANKVRSICQNDRKRYAIVWNGIKEHFKVERYQDIPSVKFAEALGYIDIIALSTFQHDFSSTMPNRELQVRLEHIYDLVELLADSKLNQMLKNRIHDLSKILA